MHAICFEDDELLARLIVDALKEICESVHHSETLADFRAYRLEMALCPSLVWMDVRAPGNTPQDVFDEIRAIRECCPHSIIVVMSGMPKEDVYQQALVAGADFVEMKPCRISPLDLARVISSAAINAMQRGASDGPRVLTDVCSMAIRYFRTK